MSDVINLTEKEMNFINKNIKIAIIKQMYKDDFITQEQFIELIKMQDK